MQQSRGMLDDVLRLAKQLSPLEKMQLIEKIAPAVEAALTSSATPLRRRGLRGLFVGSGVTDADIDEARREMWDNFPREDV